jgi:Ca2+:H+ antiporter
VGKFIYYLLPAILFSVYFKYNGNEIALFFAACLSIVPLAGIMGEATENLACYAGEKVGGFLNATFGNATELLITIFALQAGLFDVVKASIAGSILGNILLVLGLSIFVGGLKNGQQVFDRTHVNNQTSLMLLSVIALIIPAVFFPSQRQHHAWRNSAWQWPVFFCSSIWPGCCSPCAAATRYARFRRPIGAKTSRSFCWPPVPY